MAGFLGNLLAGGPGAAERFLRDWFGPSERNPGQAGVPREVELPKALLDLHSLAQRWPRAVVQNELLSLPLVNERRVVFYVENQGV